MLRIPTNYFSHGIIILFSKRGFIWDHNLNLKKIALFKHLCKQKMKPPVRNHLAGHYWKQMISKRSWTHHL